VTSDNSHYSIVKDLLQLPTSGVAKTPKIQHSLQSTLDCLNAQLRAVNKPNRFGLVSDLVSPDLQSVA